MAEEAIKINAFLIHYSAGHVYDEMKGCPYTDIDSPHPLDIYGLSKLLGEEAIQPGMQII